MVGFLSTLLALVVLVQSYCLQHVTAQQQKNAPILFNFGDSNSDTGGLAAAEGYLLNAPYGRAFHVPTGRICDGRLIVDYLCESVGTGYLHPYLDAVGILDPNFTNGANFAFDGAAVNADNDTRYKLNVQLLQFTRLRSLSHLLSSARPGQLPDKARFGTAVYTVDIGQNDIWLAFRGNMSYHKMVGSMIPKLMTEVRRTMSILYGLGARKFWFHNTGPLGCLPNALTRLPPGELDSAGCLVVPNDVARAFNSHLIKVCQDLRTQLAGTTFVYVDLFTVKYDIISKARSYGFDGPPLKPCYNETTHEWCDVGTKYISWDGVHYSDAANSIIAAKIVSGNYSNPPLSFKDLCNM